MPRPSVTWINCWYDPIGWTVTFHRDNGSHHTKNGVSLASRRRLASLLGILCRTPIGPFPLFLVRPHAQGWYAYPAPGQEVSA